MSKDFSEVRMVSLKSVKIAIEVWKNNGAYPAQLDNIINQLPYHVMVLRTSLEAMTHEDLERVNTGSEGWFN